MSHVSLQALGFIVDNYADVIEGGNAYRGSGTSHYGIPGTRSNDKGLRDGDDTPLTATAGGSTTAFTVSGGSWATERWVKEFTPGFLALCTSATNSDNENKARRITNWNDTTKVFTVDAFPSATAADDVFSILHGFKRIPNNIDIMADAEKFEHGFDRFFHLRALPGQQLDWYGASGHTYQTILELRLRILKYAREHDAVASALENLAIIRSVITRGANPDHRDGTYTRALVPTGQQAEIEHEDGYKVVALDRYELIYRLDTTFG